MTPAVGPARSRRARRPGLTPGPISNPGVSALLSVADAREPDGFSEEHKAYYFLTDCDGKMYYGNTEEEHLKNIEISGLSSCEVKL